MDMMRQKTLLAIGVCALSANALAFRGELSAGLGAEYSDNATLVDTGKQDELTGIALLGFRGSEQSSALRWDVRSLVERRNYQDNLYNDETLFSLGGNLDWSMLQDRLNWYVGDSFTQESSDRTAPQTPNNTINVNTFSTGPDLTFRLTPVDRVIASGRYSDYYFEDNTSDSERHLFSLAWAHLLPVNGELSATISTEDAKFTEVPSNQDFRRNEIFGAYTAAYGKSTFEGDLGVSMINREVGDDLTGFLGRINWLRQLGVETSFEVDAYSQYTDSGTNLLNSGVAQQAQTIGLGNEQLSADVLYDQRLGMTYRYGHVGRSIAMGVFARNEDYETVPLDRKSHGARLDGIRSITQLITGNAYLSYTYNDYTDTAEIQKDIEAGVGMDYRLSRRLTLGVNVSRNSRNSDVAGSDYDENRALLLLYYGANPYSFR